MLATINMDSYQFYKSTYDRELNRRKDLDSAVNLPSTILSIVVAANSYILKAHEISTDKWQYATQKILILLISICLAVSIYYLTKSYNNLFKGFAYKNLALTSSIREYETVSLADYNSKVDENNKLSFDNIIINKLTSITDNHTIFNDRRSLDLYRAKTFLIICIILTAINFLIFSTKIFKAMSNEKDNTGSNTDKPIIPQFPTDRIELNDVKPSIPQFPIDRIEKGEKSSDFDKKGG